MSIKGGFAAGLPEYPKGFALQPEEPAEEAVTAVLQRLFAAARQYEAGLIADIDTEFVHRYRVSIRKCRALLSLFKTAFSAPRHQQLKAALKGFAGATGLLRDLDVLLLAADVYREVFPQAQQPIWQELVAVIEARRQAVWQQTAAELQSAAYREQAEWIAALLQSPAEWSGQHSRHAIVSLASSRVLTQFGQVVTLATQIDRQTPAEKIHDLRIEAKKLRYLLELFSGLYDEKTVSLLVGQLRGLQNRLGHFNDLVVQAALLETMAERNQLTVEQRACIGHLREYLLAQQFSERAKIQEAMAGFAAAPVREQVQKTFAS